MRNIAVFLISLFFIGQCALSNAAEAEYEYTAHDKFSRGIFNGLTFIFEIPVTVYKVSVDENPVMGILYGAPLGFANGLLRMWAGAVELITFPFPPYEPMVEPEYLFFKKKVR